MEEEGVIGLMGDGVRGDGGRRFLFGHGFEGKIWMFGYNDSKVFLRKLKEIVISYSKFTFYTPHKCIFLSNYRKFGV